MEFEVGMISQELHELLPDCAGTSQYTTSLCRKFRILRVHFVHIINWYSLRVQISSFGFTEIAEVTGHIPWRKIGDKE